MNDKKHIQLLADMILFPFTHPEFEKKDPLKNFAKSYSDIVERRTFSQKTKNEIEKNFISSKKELLQYFLNDLRWEHLDDVNMFLEMFFSGIKLSNYYDDSFDEIGRFYIQHIFDIARVFITFRDGIVSIRSWSSENDPFLENYNEFDKIELWNHISRSMTPDLFIAASYINFNVDDMNCFYNVPNLIYLDDMLMRKVLNKGVAETHIHANAGISYQHLWKNNVSLHNAEGKDSNLWYCTFFRLFSAIYIESNTNQTFDRFLTSSDSNDIDSSLFMPYISDTDTSYIPDDIKLSDLINNLKRHYNFQKENFDDVLFNTIYAEYSGRNTSSELIWLYRIMKFLRESYDPLLCNCFIRYIRLKNNYFKDKIQQTLIGGLDFFQRFYDDATSIPKLETETEEEHLFYRYKSLFEEQCRTGNLKVLEIKVKPKIISSSLTNITSTEVMQNETLKQVKTIIRAYKSYIEETAVLQGENTGFNFPKLGIIYHFIKQNRPDNFSGVNCIVNKTSDFLDCFDYNTLRITDMKFIDALNGLIKKYPLLSDYIVGLDAASIENATEPWVFAPVFCKARTHRYVIPYSPQKRGPIQNIGFTYHVGEDFRHIISGLRHIDEVLTHFKYRSGDRLGHAIALGIDIDKLVSGNNVVALPVMEYLENLLWIWEISKSNHYDNAPTNLELKILEVAKKIYQGNLKNIDVYTLSEVYKSKFKLLQKEYADKLDCGSECRLIKILNKEIDWSYETLLCSHFCPCFFEIYNAPVFVKISVEDVLFYKEIQRNLIHKVEKMGVYVETNPSSNLTVGDIKSIFEHPILRLNNKGLSINDEACAMVSINSDDPIVFSTFVDNEISYIYYALLNAGCTREEALTWIDKIRVQGIESSFIKHNKSCAEMLEDFEKILQYDE